MKLEKLSSVDAPEIATKAKDDPKKVMAAAKDFESLLIGQMMKSMSQNEGGWMGSGDDQSSSSAMEYAQETFAQQLSKAGGLGLANMVFKGLKDA